MDQNDPKNSGEIYGYCDINLLLISHFIFLNTLIAHKEQCLVIIVSPVIANNCMSGGNQFYFF